MQSHYLTTYKLKLKCNNPEIEKSKQSSLAEILEAYFERQEKTANVVDKYLVLEKLEKDINLFQGQIKAGSHGITGELTNIESGEKKAEQTLKDALLHPYFFRIHCYDQADGIMVMQKIGIVGIKTAFENDLKEFIASKFHDYSINMLIEIQNSVAKEFFSKSKAQSIKIDIQNCPDELGDELEDNEMERYKKTFSATLVLKPDQFVDKWLTNYKKSLDKPGTMTIYGQKVNGVKVECKLNGRTRTFNMENILSTGIDLEIGQRYIDPLTGHPFYIKIKNEAENLSQSMLDSILNVTKN